MITKLIEGFADYRYRDEDHSYFYKDGRKLTSVTQCIGKLKEPYNSDFWTIYKAFEHSGYPVKYKGKETFSIDDNGTSTYIHYKTTNLTKYDLSVTPEMLKEQWELDAFVGTERGTYLHNLMENIDNRILDKPKFSNKIFNLETPITLNFIKSLSTLENLAYSFKNSENYLIPISMEFVIGDINIGLAGRFDRLYYNKRTEQYEIWDFKTDKKFTEKNKYQKIKLFDVDDSSLEKYSIQTSLYKYIIEEAIGEKIGNSNIVWFDYKNTNQYHIIQCKDYTNKIKQLKNDGWTAYK